MRSASEASARDLLGHEQDRELVAADARQRVLRPEVALQPPREGQQQAVADDEAERGIGRPELVDVDDEDRGANVRLGSWRAASPRQAGRRTARDWAIP